MVGFDLTCHVVRVEVEGAEVLVDLVDWAEALDGGGCGLEDGCAGLGWLAGNFRVTSCHTLCVCGWVFGLRQSVKELERSTSGFGLKESDVKCRRRFKKLDVLWSGKLGCCMQCYAWWQQAYVACWSCNVATNVPYIQEQLKRRNWVKA